MGRRKNSPNRPPEQRAVRGLLTRAWADYRASTRPLWNFITATERRFLHSLDVNSYTIERRQVTQRQVSTWASWIAAVRRIAGPHARVEVLALGPTQLPECCLVRVPKGSGSIVVDDYIVGRPRAWDQKAYERIAVVVKQGRPPKPIARGAARREAWYRKMVAALREARQMLVTKAQALDARTRTARGDPEYQRLSRTSYLAHSRADRCMRRATAYKNKLAAVGLVYDMTQIETPLEEAANGHNRIAGSGTGSRAHIDGDSAPSTKPARLAS